MLVRLAVAAAVIVVVLAVAAVVRRRARPVPPPRTAYPVPRQLDRADFPEPTVPVLVAYFWSRTCDSCEGLGPLLASLAADDTVIAAAEATDDRALHRRYEVQAIPMILISDGDGVVRRAFVGAPEPADLFAAVSAVRSPGSVPEPGPGSLED